MAKPLSEAFPLLHDPPDGGQSQRWILWILIFGWMAGYQRQLKTERALVNQAIARGQAPESAWSAYTYNKSIRQTIEEIVIDHAFPKGSTFHPHDPVELMFVLRYGDLNEVEIVMEIEKKLRFKLDDALVTKLVAERTTFIDFIKLVEADGCRE